MQNPPVAVEAYYCVELSGTWQTAYAMEQIKLLEQKALAEQQQLQLQKTKPPPPAKKKGIIGSLKDLMKKTPPPPKPEEKDEKAKAKKKKPVTPVAVSSLADIEAKLAQQTQQQQNESVAATTSAAPSSLAALEAKLTQQSISQAPPSTGRRHFVTSARGQVVTILRGVYSFNTATDKVDTSTIQTSRTTSKAKENWLVSSRIRPTRQRHVRKPAQKSAPAAGKRRKTNRLHLFHPNPSKRPKRNHPSSRELPRERLPRSHNPRRNRHINQRSCICICALFFKEKEREREREREREI